MLDRVREWIAERWPADQYEIEHHGRTSTDHYCWRIRRLDSPSAVRVEVSDKALRSRGTTLARLNAAEARIAPMKSGTVAGIVIRSDGTREWKPT